MPVASTDCDRLGLVNDDEDIEVPGIVLESEFRADLGIE